MTSFLLYLLDTHYWCKLNVFKVPINQYCCCYQILSEKFPLKTMKLKRIILFAQISDVMDGELFIDSSGYGVGQLQVTEYDMYFIVLVTCIVDKNIVL